MFNLFTVPVNKPEDLSPTWSWATVIKDKDGKQITVEDLILKYNTILNENKILREDLESIEEDGTEEHNNAIKLREENAQLKIDLEKLEEEIKNLKIGAMHWRAVYDERADYAEELEKKNNQLTNRINEIDSDQNEEYRAEIFVLKNEIAVLKSKYTELLEKYNGTVTKGGLKYMEAKLQIIQNRYKKCAEERDEFKHQLNAANKEIEKLKKDIIDYVYEKDEEKSQYPIHWGGWDKEIKPCPCNKCKEHKQETTNLEQRINKLEKQSEVHKLLIDQLNKYILCQKPS